MISSIKIENNVMIIKLIENNNSNSITFKIKIDDLSLQNFRELYINIHKNSDQKIIIDNLLIEYNDGFLKMSKNDIEYRLNKYNDIIDLVDKIILNLMISQNDAESPRSPSKYQKFEK